MNTQTNDGGPAFPQFAISDNYEFHPGMTLRDYFAGEALQGIIQVLHRGIRPQDIEGMAQDCFGIADAMLVARERKEDA